MFDSERLMRGAEANNEALPDPPYAVEGGAVLACAILALVLASLLGPVGGGRSTLDAAALAAIGAWTIHVPFAAEQGAVFKAGVVNLLLAAGVVALWARPSSSRFRARVVIALLTAAAAYVVARLAQHVDPYAVLLAIATIVAWTVGWRSGLAVLAVALYVCVLRIGFGGHWPSDVVGGALLGAALVTVAFRLRALLRPVTNPILAFAREKPSVTAAIGFVLLAQVATGFSTLKLLVTHGLAESLFR